MADLRRHVEALKLKHVSTFIASGNVIFDLPTGNPAALERRIEKHLAKVLGYEVPAFIRTVGELRDAVEGVPFPKVLATDSLYVSFMRAEADDATRRAILALESPVDAFGFRGREFYWLCRGKISEVSVAWPRLEKLAKAGKGAEGTSRNITTLRKLIEAAGG